MIGILNYGLGNVNSFISIIKNLNHNACLINNQKEMDECSHYIIPGVGSFDGAMSKFKKTNILSSLKRNVLENQKPLMGICVGMQILGLESEEGNLSGLQLIEGSIVKFQTSNKNKLPHIGWNAIKAKKRNKILDGIQNEEFYFLHSFYFDIKDKDNILATSEYIKEFPALINHKNIYGVQFHPEKSHASGMRLIKNFIEI